MSGASFDTTLVGGAMFGTPLNDVIAFSAPTLSTALNLISTAVGDIDGGYSVTLTGTSFTGATGVTFGGSAASSVVVVNSTTITCTAPAHATGAVDVLVTTPGGTNSAGNNAWEYFSPAQLSPALWQRGYSASVPWAGTASAGTSGSNSLVTGGSNPTSGATLNGFGTASFNGSNNFLTTSTNYTNLISNAAGTLIALLNASAAQADPGSTAPYNIAGFMVPTTGDFGYGFTTSGIRGGYYNGTYDSVAAACGTGAWNVGAFKWDSSNEKARANGGAWVSGARGAATLTPATSDVGTNFSHSAWYTGLLAELLAFQSAVPDATVDKIRGYFSTRYNLSTV